MQTTQHTFSKQLRRFIMLALLTMVAPVMAADMNSGILKGFDGSFHTLDEYTGKGQWTIVMLWASYCPACNAEAKQYEKFHTAHKDRDARMLGVSLDGMGDKDDAEKFIERHKITFPNLIEEPMKVAKLYENLTGKEWLGTPSFLVFSPDGELRAAQVGAVPTQVIESFIAKEGGK